MNGPLCVMLFKPLSPGFDRVIVKTRIPSLGRLGHGQRQASHSPSVTGRLFGLECIISCFGIVTLLEGRRPSLCLALV